MRVTSDLAVPSGDRHSGGKSQQYVVERRDFPPLWGSPLGPTPPDPTCFAHEGAGDESWGDGVRTAAAKQRQR